MFKINDRLIKVESCDLLSNKIQFIHVKRNSGEASLCHLFFQGWKSAKYLMHMTFEYLDKLKQLLIDMSGNNLDYKEEKVDTIIEYLKETQKQKEIVFCIIDKSKREDSNKLNITAKWYLCNIFRDLKPYNFNLIVKFIHFISAKK